MSGKPKSKHKTCHQATEQPRGAGTTGQRKVHNVLRAVKSRQQVVQPASRRSDWLRTPEVQRREAIVAWPTNCVKRYGCDQFTFVWNKFLPAIVKETLGKWNRSAVKKHSQKGD